MEASYESGLSQVVVLLLGEKQSGKSSAGNTILGKSAFHKKTTHSSRENGTSFGKQVTVVDTPGWLSHSTTPDRVSQELCRGLTLCHPEPHVILLVLPITSTFGREEWKAMEAQLRILQTPIWQRAMVLFTHGDKLAHLAGPVGGKPALGLILLGRSKSGKSSAGNMILDREEFQVATKTIRCSVGHGEVSGWPVTVVDTPGWSLFGLTNPEQVWMEISRSPSLCPARSKVCFLLAVPVDSFKTKDRKAVELHLSFLGNDVWKSTVVLFTYGEELKGRSVEEHIKKKGEPLQWVLDRCGHRHHVFDTNTGDGSRVNQLLQMVEQL